MQTIQTSSIVIEDRQRKSFDQKRIDDLAKSISQKGLLHPIVLRENEGTFVLVAGGRRLKAIEKLANKEQLFSCNGTVITPGTIPYILVTDLDAVGYREAELEENVIRVDLTWQERTAAIAALHELRVARNPKQTYKDTALELDPDKLKGKARHEVSNAVIVNKFLDDPEVSKARDEKEAFAIVSRKLTKEFNEKLRAGKTLESPHTLIKGPFEVIGPTLEEGKFSCVIADPPYGIGADKFGDAAKLEHEYKDDWSYSRFLYSCILETSFRVCKSQAHIYLFCDIDSFVLLKAMARNFGWKPRRAPLLWRSGTSGHITEGPLGFRRNYELILFASKGGKYLNHLFDDLIEDCPTVKGEAKVHAAQKPVKLYRTLLSLSTMPGDEVLDPCCGSGTIFPATQELKLKATGVEAEEKAWELAQQRLEEVGK